MTAPTLSVCMMSRKPAARVRAILELFRPYVEEIVLAADRTGDPTTLEACADLVDKRFAIDPAPLSRRLGWLQAQCASDWILRFDDDEVPSASLLRSLRLLIADRNHMQIGFPRRWLFGSGSKGWITRHPWTPDYQIRLLRNVPGAWRFPGVLHAPIEVFGELHLADDPIYHCELLLADLDARRAKRDEYEARRPGHRNGDFPVNWYYTPEDCGDVETAPTPAEDLDLIRRVERGSAGPVAARARAPVLAVSTWEAERFNGSREVSGDAYAARVQLRRAPAETARGTMRQLEVAVTNLGDEVWPWGDYPPFIRLGYRWSSGAEGRCLFTETIRPGETALVPASVLVPPDPGRYRLEIDVVHEHVRWFGQPAAAMIEVR
jgi:hypothetical protein